MKRALPLLLIAAACSADRISTVKSELVVDPGELRWERTFVGFRVARDLEVRNLGRAPLDVQLETSAPFSTRTALRLDGGATETLKVYYEPPEPGDHAGNLFLTASDRLVVPLSGHAETAPDCTSDDPCHTSELDPEKGCVIHELPDDAPCGDECASGARCKDGECLGAHLACGGDRCQVCVAGVGCQPVEPEVSCPSDPTNPCLVPACDRALGCVLEPVPDATPCGPLACTHGAYQLCFGGKCENREPKDGVPCGEKTPCRDFGICKGSKCEEGQEHDLEVAFEHKAEGVTLHFDGVANDAGTLYWAECAPESCSLLATTRDGFPLFTETMFREPDADQLVGALALVGESVISTLRPGHVESYSADTGERLWSHALVPDLPAELATAVLAIGSAPAANDGVVAVTVLASRGILGFDPLGAFLIGMELSNGSTRFVTPLEREAVGLIADGRGSFYLTEDAEGGRLVAVDGQGAVAWARPVTLAPPLAAAQGRVFHPTAGVFDVASGAPLGELPYHLGGGTQDLLVWSGSAYGYGYPYVTDPKLGTYPQFDRPMVFRVDVESLKPVWEHLQNSVIVGARSRPVLTRAGTVLLARNEKDLCTGSSRLAEYGDEPGDLLDCPLPGAGFAGTALLMKDRYVIVDTCTNTIRSLILEGYDAPSRGWIAPGGNPGRSQAPRQ